MMVNCFMVVMKLVSVIVVTPVIVSVKHEVLVIVYVFVTVNVWVVGVALAQKLLRNMSTSRSY